MAGTNEYMSAYDPRRVSMPVGPEKPDVLIKLDKSRQALGQRVLDQADQAFFNTFGDLMDKTALRAILQSEIEHNQGGQQGSYTVE